MLLNTLVLVVLHSALRVSGLEVLSGASNETTHSITVHASSHNGKFKNVQGTMNIDDCEQCKGRASQFSCFC